MINISLHAYVLQVVRPIKGIRKQIIRRGRGAAQLDVYKYKNLERVQNKSFDLLPDESFSVGNLRVKLAPPSGFSYKLNTTLIHEGINPAGRKKENGH